MKMSQIQTNHAFAFVCGLYILLLGVTLSQVQAAKNDVFTQSNQLTVNPSEIFNNGIVQDNKNSFYTCQNQQILKTNTYTGVTDTLYFYNLIDDTCRGLVIDSQYQFLYIASRTNVFRRQLNLTWGEDTVVTMNNATNPWNGGAALINLAIDGLDQLYVWDNDGKQAWTFQLDHSGTPGEWTPIADTRTQDPLYIDTISVDFVVGQSARVLIFSQLLGISGGSRSTIGMIDLNNGLMSQEFLNVNVPMDQFIKGIVPISSSNVQSTFYVSIGDSPAFQMITFNLSDHTAPTIIDGGQVALGGSFNGPVRAASYDRYFGNILLIGGTNVFRIINEPTTFYLSTHFPLLSDDLQTYSLVFTPPALTSFQFNVTTTIAAGFPNMNTSLQFTVEAGSNVMFFELQPPSSGQFSSYKVNFQTSSTPSQWPSQVQQETIRPISPITLPSTYGMIQPVDRISSLGDYKLLKGATAMVADSMMQHIYVVNGGVINKISNEHGNISTICTAGTNTNLIGLVLDNAFLYAIDDTNVYRCSLSGGQLQQYNAANGGLGFPLRGIALSTPHGTPVLFVTAGGNIQSVITNGTSSSMIFSSPILTGNLPFDFPQLIVAQPDGQKLWCTGRLPNTTHFAIYTINFIEPQAYRDLNSLTGMTTVALFFGYTSFDVNFLTLSWDTQEIIFKFNNGNDQLAYCDVATGLQCAIRYNLSGYQLNMISFIARGGGSLFLLASDRYSNSTYTPTRILRASSRQSMVGFTMTHMFPIGNYAYVNQTNTLRVGINQTSTGPFVLEAPITMSVKCIDANHQLVNDPSQLATSYELFDFNYYPTITGPIQCVFNTFSSHDLIRVDHLNQLFTTPYSITVVDTVASVTVTWPTVSTPLYADGYRIIFWNIDHDESITGETCISITCTDFQSDPSFQSITYTGVHYFNLTGGVSGVNTTCTARLNGPQASRIKLVNPVSDPIPVLAQRIFTIPITTGASPIVVYGGGNASPYGSYQLQITRPSGNSQAGDVSVGYMCTNSVARFTPSSLDTLVINFSFGQRGVVRCLSVIQYSQVDDTGMYQIIPDMYFNVVESNSLDTQPTTLQVNGIPIKPTGSNTTTTDFTITIANPLLVPTQSITLLLTCSSYGPQRSYHYDYPANVSISQIGFIGTDTSMSFNSTTSTVTFNGVSSNSAAYAFWTITVGAVPVGTPAVIECQWTHTMTGQKQIHLGSNAFR